MKKYYLLCASLFSCIFCIAQNVAINNDATPPDNSAILDVKSSSKGVLVPRMSETDRAAILNPATGLLIYQKDGSAGFYYNAGSPSSPVWLQINSSASAGWNLTGNAGTNPATNFLGTTDNAPIIFKHNNKLAAKFDHILLNYFIGNQSGEITTGRNNVAFGNLALGLNTSGHSNVAIGSKALYGNTINDNLVAVGDSALYNNGAGAAGANDGRWNTAVGSKSLFSNTIGFGNTGIGDSSLYMNTTGIYNTAVGSDALVSNTDGSRNTAIGKSALYANTFGAYNSAFGSGSMLENISGSENSAFGVGSLSSNISGFGNTAQGMSSLYRNTTGGYNSAFGSHALFANVGGYSNCAFGGTALTSNTSGIGNTSLGASSMQDNTTGKNNVAVGLNAARYNVSGSANVAIGVDALYRNQVHNNLVAIGDSALYNNGVGATSTFEADNNTAVGSKSLFSNTTGWRNTALGSLTLNRNNDGDVNTAIGYASLYDNVSGSGNTAIGNLALTDNLTGHSNVAIGSITMQYSESGSENTAVGTYALGGFTLASNNTGIGFRAEVAGGIANATAIGSNAYAGSSNSMVLGSIAGVNFATSSTFVGIGTTTPLARLHLKSNSAGNAILSQLLLEEDGDDYTRLTMRNTTTPSRYWDLGAYTHATNANARLSFYYQGVGDVLYLKGDGNATLMGTLTQLSDARLKKNIQPLTSSINNLIKLSGYQYNWKDQNIDQSSQLGVLAQEVEKVFPQLVKKDDNGALSVNYSGFIPVLITAMKEQQQQISTQQEQIYRLERKLDALLNKK